MGSYFFDQSRLARETQRDRKQLTDKFVGETCENLMIATGISE